MKHAISIYTSNSIDVMRKLPHWRFEVPVGENVVFLTTNDSAVDTLLEMTKRSKGHLLLSEATLAPTEAEGSILPYFFHGSHLLHRSINHSRNATYLQAVATDATRLSKVFETSPTMYWTIDLVASGTSARNCILSAFFHASCQEDVVHAASIVSEISGARDVFNPNVLGLRSSDVGNVEIFSELKTRLNPYDLMNSRRWQKTVP